MTCMSGVSPAGCMPSRLTSRPPTCHFLNVLPSCFSWRPCCVTSTALDILLSNVSVMNTEGSVVRSMVSTVRWKKRAIMNTHREMSIAPSRLLRKGNKDMARELPLLGMASGAPSPVMRRGNVRQGIGIELVTIVWMLIEASVAISVGFATRSVSLQGFGIDSIVELIAGGILLWRLLVEQRGGSSERIEQAERRASWITALSLFALAIYIVAESALALLTRTRPEASWWGVGLAVAAAIIMPLLW